MRTTTTTEKKVEPPLLALRVEDAAKALAIGRTMAYWLIAEGRLKAIKIGSRTVVPVKAIEEFLLNLGSAA
ncbi:MAG: helix-turn-helix domain-containing protein [Betaproteobacteria bacterium]